MGVDVFSTNVLNSVVQDMKQAPSWFLDRYFPQIQTEESEEIHFDVIDRKRRVAPFVSPLREGKIVEGAGFATKSFKPAYVKDKRPFTTEGALKRWVGERLTGSMSPMDRQRAKVAFELQDQLEMLTRRFELMAATVMRTGKITIAGEGYPTTIVDFQRATGNTSVLTSPNRWTDTGINPLDNLEDWALAILKLTGIRPTDVIFDVGAWKVFRENTFVKARLDLQRTLASPPSIDQGAQLKKEGAVLVGTIDNFNCFVYGGWYVDDNDVEQPILPDGTVILTGDIEGVRAFGAIRDEEAGFQAVPYYSKSWLEKDPSVRYLLMQSAPLMVPCRPNTSYAVTVK
jgi:hypothetical protein